MFARLRFAVIFGLLQAISITADIDAGTFVIYNENHNKCIKVESASSLTLAECNPHVKEQQFRWASESRILSLSLKLCLGAAEVKDWVKVLLFDCDESSELQHWQCKNETLFGLKDQDLHLNWGNHHERSIMIYKGSGVWSRWRIFGTRGDLCSKGYRDVFTIDGNSNGKPCQFPFKFNDDWYAECTTKGRQDGQLWCATERDYDEVKKWGFCPTKDTSGWKTDPVTRVQYQSNPRAALTWYQARTSCLQQGAELLSILELHEQSYISGLTAHLSVPLWIGLNSLSYESGWQWSNRNPFRYLNWAPGHPSSEPGFTCATQNPVKASKWETHACTTKLGYICRKGNSTSDLPAPIKGPFFCPNHWVPYAGHCYHLERSKKMWREALAACRKEGGDLASIHNIEEQSFILSQTGYTPSDVLWIGLNDQKNQMLFEWSDNSPVTFTQWLSTEPSHASGFQEDCVVIRGKDAKWADHMCEKTYGYICKKIGSTKPAEGLHEEVNPGCKLGSTRFGSFCYNVGIETKTFDDAKRACSETGANLVDVADRYENAFLVSMVGMRPEKYFWTGLSNTVDRNTFKWTTRRTVSFTHFNVGMPDKKQGCVTMTTGTLAGLWDVVSCSNKEKYICKKLAEGVQTTTVPPTTPVLSCASGWTPVTGRNVCFKHYKNKKLLKKTWSDANDFCKAIGGNLMSIHSSDDLNNLYLYTSSPAWIGLSYLGVDEGFIWTDGSPIGFEQWRWGEPNNHNDNEHCGEIQNYYGKQWNDRDCDAFNDWICQIKKGATPKPEPVVVEQVYNKTDDGWLIYNDTQYFINNKYLAMEDARAYCRKNFGELAVITGESERKFLWKQISRGNDVQYYIGMRVDLDQSFSWLDGTPVTYTAWEHNEPNFANNDEHCVTMYKSMAVDVRHAHLWAQAQDTEKTLKIHCNKTPAFNEGFWNDINCGLELTSICKRSSSSINTTMIPTTVPKGGCAPEWMFFQGKCYKIIAGQDNKEWQDARSYCINQGGNLVSVDNEKVQAFLTTQMLPYNQDFWIGMNDINWEYRFVWTDGKRISYTNWAKGQPQSPPEGYTFMDEKLDCVVMMGSITKTTGHWTVADCLMKHGFICKRNPDSQIAVHPTTVLPNAFYKLGNDSYKLETQKMKWEEARRQCLADDAALASILNPVIQAYLSLQISKHKEPVWIGLNNNMTGGRFKWVDNWVLSYTQWGNNEPRNNYGCVYMDVDNTWKTAPCTNSYYSLCKRSSDVAPTEPPQHPGSCPDTEENSWIPFRGHCYSFFNSDKVGWDLATVACLKKDATLLSIQDPLEGDFIHRNLEVLQDVANYFWIGLYRSDKGDWRWIDKSVMDYTNWINGMPKSELCVQINSDSGKWSTVTCLRYSSYICKTPKVITPTEKPPAVAQVVEVASGGSSAGVSVAIVLIVIALAGIGAFLVFRKRIPMPVLGESTFDNKLYFNNPFRTAVDTKGLVVNIEQNEQT